MVYVEAPDEIYSIVILEEDEMSLPEIGQQFCLEVEFNIKDSFRAWCLEHGVKCPDDLTVHADPYEVLLGFDTDEEAVLFVLLWKGCGYT